MRLPLFCAVCADGKTYFADANDDGTYVIDCEAGHRSMVLPNVLHVELLYERAALAIVDRYYREAIATFNAALERFYEFYVQVQAIHYDVPERDLETAWKELSRQSERQLGAYIFAGLLARKEAPPTLPRRLVEQRNEVVHQGRFADREGALSFGQSVAEIIYRMYTELRETREVALATLIRRLLDKARQNAKASGLPIGSTMLETMICLRDHASRTIAPDLRQWVTQLERSRTPFVTKIVVAEDESPS